MPTQNQPIVGASRDASCRKTIGVFRDKLEGLVPLEGRRVLDVGCGDGSFTEALTTGFQEVYAIDVQDRWLQPFRDRCGQDPKFHIFNMSASDISFDSGSFDKVISVETIEHIPDLDGAALEIARVLRANGDLIMTCPNRWFPFENHGIRWRGREISGRVPLLPYVPPLHDRMSLARVFTVRRLKAIFEPCGFELRAVDYSWPTFEHGGNRFQGVLRPLFGLMRRLERSPLRMFGSSVVTHFRRSAD